MEGMTEIDAKILKYIAARGSASMEELKKKFPDVSSIEYRLKILSKPEYHHFQNSSFSIPKENSSLLRERTTSTRDQYGGVHVKGLGIYELTEYGDRELQDYFQKKRSTRKDLWLKNAWIPIIVAFVTTVIANYILPTLPQMLQWLSNILSKFSS